MATAELLDLNALILPDHPVEWEVVSPELQALLRPAGGIFTPAQDRLLRSIVAKRWFLIRNNGPQGERWRCRRCRRLHTHFTVHCRPFPYNGLTHAIGLLKERVGPDMVYSALALGMVEPITRDRAQRLFLDLRALGYSAQDILGGTAA